MFTLTLEVIEADGLSLSDVLKTPLYKLLLQVGRTWVKLRRASGEIYQHEPV